MNHKEYNGYHNYETWLVSLWIDNEESSQSYWNEQAQETYDRTDKDSDDRKHEAACSLADCLKNHFEEVNPCQDESGFWTDLINAALSEVNWYEIATHMLENVEQEETEEV